MGNVFQKTGQGIIFLIYGALTTISVFKLNLNPNLDFLNWGFLPWCYNNMPTMFMILALLLVAMYFGGGMLKVMVWLFTHPIMALICIAGGVFLYFKYLRGVM